MEPEKVAPPQGEAPKADGRLKAKPAAKGKRRLQESDLKRVPWRSIGPAVMGGRIADMAFAPGDTKTFYIGFASGGLWRTTNRGTTFEQLFKTEETSSIGSVAVADAPERWKGWTKDTPVKDRKKKGKGRIVWVGTGEGNGRNSSSWGNGVYRSVDGGAKFAHCGLEETHDVPRLAVDPRDPDVCYAAALGHLWGHNTERGLYKTSDGGKSWKKVLYLDDKTGCCDVVLDPKRPDTVYAAMYMRLRTAHSFMSGGPVGGIYKSTDAGKTWKKLSGGLPRQTGRIGLDVFPGDPRKVIAVVESTEEGANSIRDDRMRGGGVFVSSDGGEAWARGSVRSPRAFYFSKIKFDPRSSKRVYMLGWTTEVSDDGGKTFREGFANILHADHHAILVSPEDPDHIVIGTDGGASQTFDGGKTWDFLNTIPSGQFYNVSVDGSDPYRVIGGLQDNGTWLGPSATHKNEAEDKAARTPATGITNSDWQLVNWGDGFHADFDPDDRDVVYGEWQGGNLVRINLATREKRYIAPEAREGEPRHRFNWNSPFFVSRHDGRTIYIGGNCVFKLTERGEKWKRISGDLTTRDPDKMTTVGSNAETHCTLVSLDESPRKRGVLWAGSDDGLVHVTRDDGGSWRNVTPPQARGRYVSRVHASAHVDGRCYVSLDGHRSDDMRPCVLATDDFGRTWKDLTGDLPKRRSVMVVREDLFNAEVLYCGTENACHVSLDRGKTWVKMHGEALPTVPVYDIKQHPRESDLVLGTHGLSIWILDGARWIGELTPEALERPLHLFSVADARPKWFLNYSGQWTHKVFRAANPATGARFDYWVRDYTGDPVKVTVEDSTGTVVKTLAGNNAPGFNRVCWDLVPEEWLQVADQGEDTLFTPFQARPGRYKVKLAMGEHKAEGSFRVLERR
jgi:photosystem II stability/assembly factor-like uncharacterized protein